MPLSRQTKVYNTFVNGLNTEANPLNFPEDTAKVINNVDLDRNGSVVRRLGMDLESGAVRSEDTFTATEIQTKAITTHEWCAVNADGNLNFAVIQIGGTLYVHDQGADPMSAEPIGKLDVSTLKTQDDFDLHPFDSTCGLGRLFIVGRFISPFYLEYDETNDAILAFKLSLKIRDVNGIDESEDSSPVLASDNTVFEEDENALIQDTNDALAGNTVTVFTLVDLGEGTVFL